MSPPRPIKTNGWLTLADVLRDLGGVSPKRIRFHPPPGRATEADRIRIQTHENRHYELVDGVLVEKIMGAPQAYLALVLARHVGNHVEDHDLGFLMGADGPTRLFKGLVRMPDLSFVSWGRMPSKECPAEAILDVAPNLAAEVISEGNTRGEIARMLKEYFLAGVELAWVIDPYKRTAAVYTAPDRVTTLTEADVLDGGAVLPGFSLALKGLFARCRKTSAGARRRGKKKDN